MFGKKKEKVEMTPEMRLAEMQIRELRRLRRQESMDRMASGMGKALNKITPKGIRHPDSLVRNAHLYGIRSNNPNQRRRVKLF